MTRYLLEPPPNLYQRLAEQRGNALIDNVPEDLIFLTENSSQTEDNWTFILPGFTPSGLLCNISNSLWRGRRSERGEREKRKLKFYS